MTIVTITNNEIRTHNHAGKTGLCIAVSAIVQSAARILEAAKELDGVKIDVEAPSFIFRVRRPSRVAKAVFRGVKKSLEELSALDPEGLSVVDERESRPYPVTMNVTHFYPHRMNCARSEPWSEFSQFEPTCACYEHGIPEDVQENYRAFAVDSQAQYSDIVWSIEDGRRVGRFERGGKKHKRIRGRLAESLKDALVEGPRWQSLVYGRMGMPAPEVPVIGAQAAFSATA